MPGDWLNPYPLQVASFVLINTLLGVSIYVTLATGQLSLGNAGFMSIGAYTTAILTTRHGFPMPAGIVAGPAAGAPARRAPGPPPPRAPGAHAGFAPESIGLRSNQFISLSVFLILFAATLCAIGFFFRLGTSRVGRAYAAVRMDERAGEAGGIDTTYYKVLAFTQGAML